jgi:phosphatidylinositol alpha-1,6-mannosyltransferase
MRQLLLLTDLYGATGGIQSYNRSILNAFSSIAEKENWDLTVLVLNDTADQHFIERTSHQPRIAYHAFSGSKAKFSRAALKYGYNANLIYFGHVHFASLALLIKLLNASAELMLAVYGIDVWRRLPLPQRLAVKQMSRILAISEYTKRRMMRENALRADLFAILPCTLQPEFGRVVRHTRRELALPEGKMILSVSRLDEMGRYKGIDKVICTLPSVLQKCRDTFYVVVGDGADRPRLESLARNIGVSERVYFTGRVSDDLLAAYYQTSDLFVLTSAHEGFGIVFLEAMACAKACIGVNAGAVPEVIEHSKTGLLIEPGNIEQLSKCLTDLLADDKRRQAMGAAAAQRYQTQFSTQKFHRRFEDIIFTLVA